MGFRLRRVREEDKEIKGGDGNIHFPFFFETKSGRKLGESEKWE